ncbi:MAG: insulinase family protein, partial [Bacteroidota bacterium]
AVFVGAFPLPLEDPGVTLAFAVANAGVSPETVESAMDAEYEKVKNELIPEREFDKLMNQTENNFIVGNATMAGIAESLANYHLYFGDANLINTELARYRKVTREDLQRVARKYLVPENRVVLHYLPVAP